MTGIGASAFCSAAAIFVAVQLLGHAIHATRGQVFSLRFFGTRDGQRFKTQVLTFLTGRGWRVGRGFVRPGGIKGRNACCLAAICLPLGFAADRTPDVVTVNLVSDGPPPLVGEHIHKPQSLDNDQWICVVCELVMTSHEVNHARAAQNALLGAAKKAEREALILANPEIKVREDRNERTAIIFVGVVIALVILGALIQAAMTAHSSAMNGSPSSARQSVLIAKSRIIRALGLRSTARWIILL